MLPFLVREALLGWLGPCVGKERKKVWFSDPLCLFWIVWKERNSRAFENEGYLIHGCKSFFLCNLWAWTKGSFLLWPPFRCRFCRLVRPCLRGSFFSLLYTTCILWGASLMCLFSFIILLFIHQKKKCWMDEKRAKIGVIIRWISWISFLFNLIKISSSKRKCVKEEIVSYEVVLGSGEAFACNLHLQIVGRVLLRPWLHRIFNFCWRVVRRQ